MVWINQYVKHRGGIDFGENDDFVLEHTESGLLEQYVGRDI